MTITENKTARHLASARRSTEQARSMLTSALRWIDSQGCADADGVAIETAQGMIDTAAASLRAAARHRAAYEAFSEAEAAKEATE